MTFGPFPQTCRRVVITGLGAVTPLGLNVASTWASACAGRSATRPLSDVPFFFPACVESDPRAGSNAIAEALERKERLLMAMPCRVAAPVLTAAKGPLSFAPTSRETRAALFARHAITEALQQAKLLTGSDGEKEAGQLLSLCAPDRVGVNIGVGMPSLADVGDVSQMLYADPLRVNYSRVNPFFVPKILGNMIAGMTAMRYGILGPIGSSVAACATGAHCIGESAHWIRNGRADVMICGGAEACITPIAVAGFSRMRALCTKYNDRPYEASRPFDIERSGFIMGEGAGVMVLEELSHAVGRGAHMLAELRGFGVSCDAHDVAAPHPEGRGAQLCVQAALSDGGKIPPMAVGYVNAHATGTVGDDLELRALATALRGKGSSGSSGSGSGGVKAPPLVVSSVKGGAGHLLGAAGSVEAIIAVMALLQKRAPPNVNLCTPSTQLDEVRLVMGHEPQPFDGEAVISTSFGFGGVNTALLLTQVKSV